MAETIRPAPDPAVSCRRDTPGGVVHVVVAEDLSAQYEIRALPLWATGTVGVVRVDDEIDSMLNVWALTALAFW